MKQEKGTGSRWRLIFKLRILLPERSRYGGSLRAGRYVVLIPVCTRFSTLVQSGPGAHAASYTIGTWSLSGGVNRPGRGVYHRSHLTSKLKKEQNYNCTPQDLHSLLWGSFLPLLPLTNNSAATSYCTRFWSSRWRLPGVPTRSLCSWSDTRANRSQFLVRKQIGCSSLDTVECFVRRVCYVGSHSANRDVRQRDEQTNPTA